MTFTKDELEAAKERCEKATKGPIIVSEPGGLGLGRAFHTLVTSEGHMVGFIRKRADAEFFTYARADLPRALAALEEAWGRLRRIQDMCDFIIAEHQPLDMIRLRFEQVQKIVRAAEEEQSE